MKKDIGALWLRNGPKGEYTTGVITIKDVAHQIVIFKNGFKDKPNQPDWRIYKSQPKPELNENGTEKVEEYPDVQIDPEDIPF